MSKVSDDEIRGLAKLARLQVSDAEVAQLRCDLEGILEQMKALADVDTEGVEPMTHVLGAVGHLRPDRVQKSLSAEQVLQGSPAVDGAFFDVPAILPSGAGK